jgi:hypothetical protein
MRARPPRARARAATPLLRDRERRGRRHRPRRGARAPGPRRLLRRRRHHRPRRARRHDPGQDPAEALQPGLLGFPSARREGRPHRVAPAAGDGDAPTRRRVCLSSSRSSRARAWSPLSGCASMPSPTRLPKRTQRTPSSSQARSASPAPCPSKVVPSTVPSPVTTRSAHAARSRKPTASSTCPACLAFASWATSAARAFQPAVCRRRVGHSRSGAH